MKSLIAAAVLAVLAVHPARASSDVEDVAATAGVDPDDLRGAVNSTGLPARTYLEGVGELARPVPVLTGAVARADCIISKESGGLDVPNRQGSGASGPGQYYAGTWAAHVAIYRRATGYVGPLSLHSLTDVRRVMALILTIPGMRSAWTVSGC